MYLEDLKTYISWGARASAVLSRRIDPIGTEFNVLEDVVAHVQRLIVAERDILLPGITKAWRANIIQGAVAWFRDKVKKDIMPAPLAKSDNLVIEPLYRPGIFGLTNFTVSWSGVTPPAAVDVLRYDLQVDKELIILTDIVTTTPNSGLTELKFWVDGEEFNAVTARKEFAGIGLAIFSLPLPVVADVSLRIQGRVETASGTFTYIPIGLHVCIGHIMKQLV